MGWDGIGMGFGGFLYATARWEDCCVYCLFFVCVFVGVMCVCGCDVTWTVMCV